MFSTKIFILFICSLAVAMATSVYNEAMTSSPIELKGVQIEELQKELQISLNNLATDGGPHYEISKVISASVQIIPGEIIQMKVDLVDTDGVIRNCDVSFWSRPWMIMSKLYGTETTIDCAGQKTLVESH